MREASPQAAPEAGLPVDTEGNPVYPIDPGPLWREEKPEGCLTHLRSVPGCYSCDKRIAEWGVAGTCKESLQVGATDKDFLPVEERLLVGDRAIAIVEELRAVLGLPVGDVVDCVSALASPQVQGGEAVAWLHEVVADDGVPDQALSFSPDNFPLEGVAGYRKVACRPLYATPQRAPGMWDYVDIANRAQAVTGRSIFPSTAKAVLEAALASGPSGMDGKQVIACHAVVSDECRTNRTNIGAASEATTRLFKAAGLLMEAWPIGKVLASTSSFRSSIRRRWKMADGAHPYKTRPVAASHVWLTPPEILSALGPFDLDPCAAPSPRPWPTAARHIELPEDGLTAEWQGRVWCNPPFGSYTGQWLGRMALHGNGIALTFARTDTGMFKAWVWRHASAVLFLTKRPHFYHPDGTRAKGNSGGPIVLIAYGEANAEALRASGLPGAVLRVVAAAPAAQDQGEGNG